MVTEGNMLGFTLLDERDAHNFYKVLISKQYKGAFIGNTFVMLEDNDETKGDAHILVFKASTECVNDRNYDYRSGGKCCYKVISDINISWETLISICKDIDTTSPRSVRKDIYSLPYMDWHGEIVWKLKGRGEQLLTMDAYNINALKGAIFYNKTNKYSDNEDGRSDNENADEKDDHWWD
jgi:succinyl-CoA synthetase beta subunit